MDPDLPSRCRRLSLAEARAVVAAWQASGLSPALFCGQQGMPLSRLLRYRTRVSQADADAAGAGFVAVSVPVPVPVAEVPVALAIEAGDGLRVVGASVGQVVEILRGLRAAVAVAGGGR
jgi:hypothetical protein